MVEFSKLIKFLNVGKHGLYDSHSRRTRIFNLIVILAVLNLTLVALPQYIFLGLEKHIYLISWSGLVGILWLLTPLFHRITAMWHFFILFLRHGLALLFKDILLVHRSGVIITY